MYSAEAVTSGFPEALISSGKTDPDRQMAAVTPKDAVTPRRSYICQNTMGLMTVTSCEDTLSVVTACVSRPRGTTLGNIAGLDEAPSMPNMPAMPVATKIFHGFRL